MRKYSCLFILLFLVVSCKKQLIKKEPQPKQILYPPVASFSFTTNSDGPPARYFFTNESDYANSCFWDFGDGSTSTSFSPDHEFTTIDTFLVSLTVSNELGSSNLKKQIIIIQGMVPDFTFTGQGARAPAKVIFTNKSLKAYSYIWDFGDSTYSEEKDPSHTYAKGGIYNVTLQATGLNGKSKQITKTISILPEYTSATITSMKLDNWPFQKPNGSDWDASPGQIWPDVYLSLEDSAGTQLYKTNTSVNLMLPATYTTSFVLTRDMWNKTLRIRMMDDDGATSEEMASATFSISDYGPGSYPNQIYLNHQYIGVYLNFSWQ